MQEGAAKLKNKLGILENINICEEFDAQIIKQKFEVLKEIALMLVNEIEALDYVRSVNISRGINLHEEMRTFEVHLIQSALERTGGHQTRAAQLLGINLTTLHNKLKRLKISPTEIVNAPIIHEDSIYGNTLAKKHLTSLPNEQFSQLAA